MHKKKTFASVFFFLLRVLRAKSNFNRLLSIDCTVSFNLFNRKWVSILFQDSFLLLTKMNECEAETF